MVSQYLYKEESLYLALASPVYMFYLLCHFVFIKFTRANLLFQIRLCINSTKLFLSYLLLGLFPLPQPQNKEGRHHHFSGSLMLLFYQSPLCSSSNRFSPSGSVVPLTERHRARSESPGRMDEPKQPSSQVWSCGFRTALVVGGIATVYEQKIMKKKRCRRGNNGPVKEILYFFFLRVAEV